MAYDIDQEALEKVILSKIKTQFLPLAVKSLSLDQAIKAGTGSFYNDEGRLITNPDKIVEAAKKFEIYLKESSNV